MARCVGLVLLWLVLVALAVADEEEACASSLNIVVHAQAHSSTDALVIGSEMTCAGFQAAFAAAGHHVQLMYPGSYGALHDRVWDIVFIEGWFPAITAFIHEIRRATHGHARVYFYCLDPDFPGLNTLQMLDVDGFFANSHEALRHLAPFATISEYLLLAATPPPPAPTTNKYAAIPPVVYVGNAVGIMTKQHLASMLREAIPFGLRIYGYAWEMHPEFAPFWAGVLPAADLWDVYSAARVILGATMDGQRASGMINNRVFEALAVGRILISDHSSALEALFGDRVLYYKAPGDMTRHLAQLVTTEYARPHTPEDLAAHIRTYHTYTPRAAFVLAIHHQLSRRDVDRIHKPKLFVVLDERWLASHLLSALYVHDVVLPALAKLERLFLVHMGSELPTTTTTRAMHTHDLVLLLSAYNSTLERTFRPVALRGAKGLFLLAPLRDDDDGFETDGAFYDIVYFTQPDQFDRVRRARTNVQNAFGWPVVASTTDVPPPPVPCDVLIVGDWDDDEQRLLRLFQDLDHGLRVTVVVPERHARDAHHAMMQLKSMDMRVVYASPGNDSLHNLLTRSNCDAIFIPGTKDVGGNEYLVAAGLARGQTVRIQPDNDRLQRLFQRLTIQDPPRWDVAHVAKMLAVGKTRPLVLGRGNASVSMVVSESCMHHPGSVDVSFETNNFEPPADGVVCLLVDGDALGCVLHDGMRFHVRLPIGSGNVTLQMALRSIVFGDVFAWSPPIVLAASHERAPLAPPTSTRYVVDLASSP
ncbi:hypothetical protein SPRG_02503 [Saprolegnia parasitica CBS 223.65]|uniref:Spore protein YkvP/CgeB glycosyl transferase-like domain-containing protein n=1 Tax=Saprolegnia parasitica (strain CBS 223.65) TaxID=695850 RepID=A0A067CU83_SAPPC|nr:hypothetical protein SPRG_02503 [Saprolegnia parasitica CBS 223.65]KDO32810.1 hypothetical protein SPRG_02503 [Saprolegnia parasitica CBS 223.65]|eukprot:XP_012196466.1 hypothetical protein SPRG_02503 [Saprolegnia parasitica CBS 223.65]